MARRSDLFLTALAPAIWGSSYIVTTELMPPDMPLTLAMLRALPAGLVLLLAVRRLPQGIWWGRVAVLGALNFTIFWAALFVAAYRLPGGVAATVGAIQPLIVIGLAAVWLNVQVTLRAVLAAVAGIGGVALLLLGPEAALDPVGIAAGLVGALSMASGMVLTRRWQPPVDLLTLTAWQLTAGGLLLVPLALWLEPGVPVFTAQNWMGWLWLSGVGAALTYVIWFRGVMRLPPSVVSSLGFLSPLSAVLLGWIVLGEGLTWVQLTGAAIVLAAVYAGQGGSLSGLRPGPRGIWAKKKGEAATSPT
ncbi:EamA family transporter [Nioella aestuarii]|uniref:EamA family transporter n=1 Tax=Nioella aestuarii TaxID=1662864 RepID=UPI003D7FE394